MSPPVNPILAEVIFIIR